MGEGFKLNLWTQRKLLSALAVAVILFILSAWYVENKNFGVENKPEVIKRQQYVTGQKATKPESQINDKITNILSNKDYQRDLPEQVKPEPIKFDSKAMKLFAEIMVWVLKIGALIGVAGIIWLIVTSFRDGYKPTRERTRPATKSPRRQEIRQKSPIPTLSDADTYANKGEYGEAVRMLLKTAINNLVIAREISVGPSTTSREVLISNDALSDTRLQGLIILVALVEKYAFAKIQLKEADFISGKKNYNLIVTSKRAN